MSTRSSTDETMAPDWGGKGREGGIRHHQQSPTFYHDFVDLCGVPLRHVRAYRHAEIGKKWFRPVAYHSTNHTTVSVFLILTEWCSGMLSCVQLGIEQGARDVLPWQPFRYSCGGRSLDRWRDNLGCRLDEPVRHDDLDRPSHGPGDPGKRGLQKNSHYSRGDLWRQEPPWSSPAKGL